MSNTIDQKVVSMEFDNKKFESNCQTSIGTLEKLKKSLNFTGATKGFENIQSAAHKCDMTPLHRSVETITTKFSALQVMAVTALANITNSAVNAGKRITSAFTVDPIKTGLQEYETQINAVQTILANTKSKGTTLTDVNGALDELNTYADKTIYNFTEMTRNIGTFTAAGVDLDKSVTSIKGIANLAAVSGSTSQQASTAMYQLSQALAAGKVQLMDWNSVVNAGMGGQVFQDALKRTATHMGTNVDAMIKKYGSFRESLTKGEWLTAEVLTETLTQLSGAYSEADLIAQGYTQDQAKQIVELADTAVGAATEVKTFTQLMDTLKEAAQSGWTQTWEILVGDFEEAKALWSGVSKVVGDAINNISESRNKMLQGWKDLGGRTMLIDGIKNAFAGLKSVVDPIIQAFKDIFPQTTSKQLLELTKNFKSLTEKFKIGDGTAKAIKNTFKGLFTIVKLGLTIVGGLAKGIMKLIGVLLPVVDGILSVTGSIGKLITDSNSAISILDVLSSVFGTVATVAGSVVNAIKTVTGSISESIGGMSGLIAVLQKVGNFIIKVFDSISEAVTGFVREGGITSALDVVNGAMITGILVGIKKFLDGLKGTFSSASGMLDKVSDILDSVHDSLVAWQTNLQAGTIFKLAGSIGILAAALLVLSTVDPNKLGVALGAVSALIAELLGALILLNRSGAAFKGAMRTSTVMIGMSTAVLILASALKKLSTLNWDQLKVGLTGVGALMAGLLIFINTAKFDGKVLSTSLGMVALAGAIKILASACSDFAIMSWEEIGKGLAAIGGLLFELWAFTKLTGNAKHVISTGISMTLLGVAMKSFASAMRDFGGMDWHEIGRGLAAMGGALLEVFLAVKFMPKNIFSISVSLIAIGVAMNILAEALNAMGSMSIEQVGKGLLAMGGALTAIAVALNFMPKGMLAKAAGMIGIASALVILSKALTTMGGMSWDEIKQGLVAMGGALLEITLAMFAMKSALPGAAALLVVSAALAVLAPVLLTLGSVSLKTIGGGLLALAGAFTIFGVAGKLLGPLAGTLLKVSLSFLAFGVACNVVGVGLTAIGVGIITLAAGLVGGVTSIVESISGIVEGIGKIIAAFCNGIAIAAPAIAKAIVAVIEAVCTLIVKVAPAIAKALFELLVAALKLLDTYIPKIADLLINILIKLMDTVATRVPEIVKSAANLIREVIKGLSAELGKGGLASLISSLESISLIFIGLGVTAKIVSTIPISGALTGIASLGIFVGGVAGILTILGGLSKIPGFTWLVGEGSKVLGQIGTAIGTFVGNIAGGIMTGVTGGLPAASKNLSTFMTELTPFIDGLKKIDGSILDSAASLAGAIACITGSSILSSITSFKTLVTGKSTMSNFGSELIEFGGTMKKFADSVSGIDASAITAAANAGKALAQMADTVPNQGGMVAWFTGENSITKFGSELVEFGSSLKKFSDSVAGVNAEAITAAANAGKALATLADTIPNEGGMVSWFTGDNSVAKFGDDIIEFGASLKAFSDSVVGVNAEAINVAVTAGKSLASLADTIPNEGGMVAWFTGDNSIAKFGTDIAIFGANLKAFSDSVVGINPEAVTAATNAGKALAQMANTIPNEGGMVAWFTGENSVAKFGYEISSFGTNLKAFSDSVVGINPEAVSAAANAGKALAEMANTIPN